MGQSFGKNLKVTIFGSSHQEYMGVVIDNVKPGFEIDMVKLDDFMQRRAPGKSRFTTKRKETDKAIFISGLRENKIISKTITALIENNNFKSKDYNNLNDIPRPSHADYTSFIKYEKDMDMNGGGPFSGRLTAPFCLAGGIAKQILEEKNIKIASRIKNIGGISDKSLDLANPPMDELEKISQKEISVLDEKKEEEIRKLLEDVRSEGDSIGGICQVFGENIPQGLGDPLFDSFEAKISYLSFGIPGLRSISFGEGLKSIKMRGSDHNDQFEIKNGKVKTITNNAGGIVGGITNGMPVVFDLIFKPTPSISLCQKSFSIRERKEKELLIKGRHDPCFALRTLPIGEAILALTVLDYLYE
ncbi:chorismate synthase [Anaerococcus hydrogenalis]|uniref:chorismate synthase n=1 Tax=Anaerococcus hydrogenalis TaxID=33029 RepID=UPI002903BFCF|nr:chorismate synthase [Anaerococcus hydrogenalis]MDU1315635.1 chorismate synthase [Anaerococcus hydrogenalis]